MIKTYSISLVLIILLTIAGKSFAQSNTDTLVHTRPETIFIEMGAAGLVFSANYDTRFTKKRNGWGGRAGIGYFGNGRDNIFTFPLQVNYLFGRSKNFFELGTGITLANINSDDAIFDNKYNISGAIGTVTTGFRHQALGKGVFYKISLDALYDPQDLHNWFLYFGIGLGYTFK
jgi:hypothetical protein